MGMETMGDGRWVTVTEIGRYLRSWCVYMLWVVYHRYHFVFRTNFVLTCGDVIACLSVCLCFFYATYMAGRLGLAGLSLVRLELAGLSGLVWLDGWMEGCSLHTWARLIVYLRAIRTYMLPYRTIPYHTILHTYPIHIPSHPDYRTDPSIHPVPCHATFPHLPTHAHFTSYVACTCLGRGGQSKRATR